MMVESSDDQLMESQEMERGSDVVVRLKKKESCLLTRKQGKWSLPSSSFDEKGRHTVIALPEESATASSRGTSSERVDQPK
jgi:hypothetical protein